MTNKASKIRALVVSMLVAVAVGAPALSIFLNAPKAQAAVAAEEPKIHVSKPYVVTAVAVTRVSDAKPAVSKKPVKKAFAAKPKSCRLRTLEAGGSPDAPFVLFCE